MADRKGDRSTIWGKENAKTPKHGALSPSVDCNIDFSHFDMNSFKKREASLGFLSFCIPGPKYVIFLLVSFNKWIRV